MIYNSFASGEVEFTEMTGGGYVASSYGEDASKDALRNGYLSAMAGTSPAFRKRIDAEIALHLRACPAYRKADVVLAYVAYRDEIDTRAIIERAWSDGKKVALPRCVGGPRSLEFYPVTSLDGLVMGTRGVLEPVVDEGVPPLAVEDMLGSICLVPGLVFDGKGYRVGYGAGYYDNFLSFYPGTKVGLARSIQISGNPLPHEEHDVPVDVIVSDGAVWMCR